ERIRSDRDAARRQPAHGARGSAALSRRAGGSARALRPAGAGARDGPRAGAGVKALVLYSPGGGGHRHAGRALAGALRARHPGAQARELDYLQFMSRWERKLWTGLYLWSLRHWPALWRNYRRFTHRPSEPRFIRNRVRDVGMHKF